MRESLVPLVAYYVSDHGYGHAARSVAVIRALIANDSNVEIVVKTASPLEFIRRCLPQHRVQFSTRWNDVGLILYPGCFQVDATATRGAVERWVERWSVWMEEERRFWRERPPSVIVSDVAPQPLLLAQELGVPGVLVSNFTWHEMYEPLMEGHMALGALRNAYCTASLGVALPMCGSLLSTVQRQVGWLVRRMGRSRDAVRQTLGVGQDEPLVYVGFGRAVQQMEQKVLAGRKLPFRVLVPEGIIGMPSAINLPASDTESQDYIGACDLVVSKAGFSTIAEAVAENVPMLLLRRDEVPEDRRSLAYIEGQSFGKGTSGADFQDGTWVDMAVAVLQERQRYAEAYQVSRPDLSG
ncbi:MAG: hypothetical protein V1724_08790, partial [Chloroflexota bacterium]